MEIVLKHEGQRFEVPTPKPVVPETVVTAVRNRTQGWGWGGAGFGGIGAAITALTGIDWRVLAIFSVLVVAGAISCCSVSQAWRAAKLCGMGPD